MLTTVKYFVRMRKLAICSIFKKSSLLQKKSLNHESLNAKTETKIVSVQFKKYQVFKKK